MAMAVGGFQVELMHKPSEREDVPIRVQLSRESRSSASELRGLYLNAPDGSIAVPSKASERFRKERSTRTSTEKTNASWFT